MPALYSSPWLYLVILKFPSNSNLKIGVKSISLSIRNTSELASKDKFKLKILIYGLSGTGKTLFCGTSLNPIVAACETGNGKGLQTLSSMNIPFVEPASFTELEQFCGGVGYDLAKYDTVVLDGFSYLADSLVKDQVLSINTRSQGNTGKRAAGVLELDDYGILAEYERRLLARLLALDKHIIVSCLQDMYQPFSASPPRPEKMGGPDLPGSMRSGSAAMFDVVMKLSTRKQLRDPKDAKSAYLERYWITESDGQYICKSRLRNGTKAIFPSEVVFDVEKDTGTFSYFLRTALTSYNGRQTP